MKSKLVICRGAALIDESYQCYAQPLSGTSNPAKYHRSAGGVARNIAHHLSLLGNQVELITHFGSDTGGKWLMDQCQASGTGISHSLINDNETGRFVAILSPGGDLFTGVVSSHFESSISPEFLQQKAGLIKQASLVQMDTNLSKESLNWLLLFCRQENIPCIIEPVSVPKAARLVTIDLKDVLLITPNRDEMCSLMGSPADTATSTLIQQVIEKGVKYLWIRNGKNGSGIFASGYNFTLEAPDVIVQDTTGAGDAALAGWMHAWLLNRSTEDCVRYGHAMASLILQVRGAINPGLTPALLESTYNKYINQHEIK